MPTVITGGQVFAALAVFAFSSMALIFTQYLGPEHLKPLNIAKRGFLAIWNVIKKAGAATKVAGADFLRFQKQQQLKHQEFARSRQEATAEQQQQLLTWQARPCAICGWKGNFHVMHERVQTHKQSAASAIAEVAIILVILAPITCGLGLILLFFVGRGNKYKNATNQQCPDCGAVRPL